MCSAQELHKQLLCVRQAESCFTHHLFYGISLQLCYKNISKDAGEAEFVREDLLNAFEKTACTLKILSFFFFFSFPSYVKYGYKLWVVFISFYLCTDCTVSSKEVVFTNTSVVGI